MKNEMEFNGKISTEKAIKMLKKEGMEVTYEEAEQILVFLRKLANIAVNSYLQNNDLKNKKDNDTNICLESKTKGKKKLVTNYCKPCIIVNTDLHT